MFYPELSQAAAMRWHLDHGQKMYNMQMFSQQFSDKFSDQYGQFITLFFIVASNIVYLHSCKTWDIKYCLSTLM